MKNGRRRASRPDRSRGVLQQAADYEGSGDLRDGVLKLLNTERTTHPFTVVRAAEIKRWAASDEYRDILAGHYPLRVDDKDASFTDHAREAARTYRKRMDESSDPLVSAVRGVSSTVGAAADGLATGSRASPVRPPTQRPPPNLSQTTSNAEGWP